MSHGQLNLEELANTVTHGIGLVLSVAGFALLLTIALVHGRASQIAACLIYGATLVCLYAASTLYHSATAPRWKQVLRIFDHSAIYLLIAGTYTPFLLLYLRGPWGWSLFGVIWGMAFAGILFKMWFVDHFHKTSTALYLAMGWLVVVAAKPVLTHVPGLTLLWLLLGGILYTIGVVFFVWKRLPYSHAVWHVFVLGGSICHYFAVLRSVLGAGNS